MSTLDSPYAKQRVYRAYLQAHLEDERGLHGTMQSDPDREDLYRCASIIARIDQKAGWLRGCQDLLGEIKRMMAPAPDPTAHLPNCRPEACVIACPHFRPGSGVPYFAPDKTPDSSVRLRQVENERDAWRELAVARLELSRAFSGEEFRGAQERVRAAKATLIALGVDPHTGDESEVQARPDAPAPPRADLDAEVARLTEAITFLREDGRDTQDDGGDTPVEIRRRRYARTRDAILDVLLADWLLQAKDEGPMLDAWGRR